ncbi:MAG: RagB/SusD family nutrient uptake outer membrane protein [Bacteroidales bacterium 36-12]|nr:MAG: RagB/SusD family nutrient uptake outer membrane protein [Bacteroidales bacterium 36-12]
MKTIIKKVNYICLSLFLGISALLSGCSDDFLKPEPVSIYEPAETFSTESGLKSVLAFCDRHLKLYYTSAKGTIEPIASEYIFSDLMVAGATDKAKMLCDVANQLTPTSIGTRNNSTGKNDLYVSLDQTHSGWHFWHESYYVIMQANTIIQYIDGIEELDEATKNAYKGRAYFHRAFRYYALVFQYGDVPLLTKVTEVPKQNYRSTKRDAILELITKDMEFAAEWVPDQKNMAQIGMVSKGACRMLLSKLYLAVGEYGKAEAQLDELINNSEYSLIQGDSFGTFNDGGEPETWPITRNVIWDMHRAENKLIAANKEVILGIVNRGSDEEGFTPFHTMRMINPYYHNTGVGSPKTKDGKQAIAELARTNANYNIQYDYSRAFGRGIGTVRPTYYQQHTMWQVNGRMDNTDLRHSSAHGNWVKMTDIKVSNKESSEFGKPLSLYDDYGNLLCKDTIRRWFDVPLYKFYMDDVIAEANKATVNFYGATNGGNGDWYLYRLAEAYLLRAEAKFYQGKDGTSDVNEIRKRAKCSELYNSITIGDIMDERARELYWEEWRNVELTRVSLCLARSGMPDEWGNTYSIDNFDKQEGTDPNGGSYWYQRVTKCGKMYNGPTITIQGGTINTIKYTMDKKNIYWPLFNESITANRKGKLAQNYGYDGYDPSTPKWETWQEAVADEDEVD